MKLDTEKLKVFLQGLKFAVVGGANTGIDFLMMNILFLVFRPSGQAGLMLISVSAACMAMLNSYFMNKYWSFSAGKAPKRERQAGEFAAFVAVSFLGLAVNTSVFLFCSKFINELFGISGFLNINASRLVGVGAAMCVTFLGYKLGVFDTQSVKEFRNEKAGDWTGGFANSWSFITSLCTAGFAVRILFWLSAPVVYGDAVNYYWVAKGIAAGSFSSVDWFWHNLFTYFEAAIIFCGIGGEYAIMLASLIPGVLLLVPIYFIAGTVFGGNVARIAALFALFSPRLIEYSVNGHSESFYMLLVLCAILVACRWIASGEARLAGAAIFGAATAGFFLTRNESIFLVLFLLPLTFIAGKFKNKIACAATLLLSFAAIVLAYVSLNIAISGHSGIMQKSSNLSKIYSEQIDWRNAARETYGEEAGKNTEAGNEGALSRTVRHFRENVFYMAERVPGVFLSPLALFIPFAGLLGGAFLGKNKSAAPLALCGIFPFIFYPLVHVEPRMLFLSLAVSMIWGSAGLWIFSVFVADKTARQSVSRLSCLALVALQIPFIPVLAWRSRDLRLFHKEIGTWISANIDDSKLICGDGYGYVLSSSFWAGKKPIPRLWTTDPSDLAPDMEKRDAEILVLYEEFAKLANPELLGVFDNGVPGLELIKEFKTKRGRIQIYSRRGQGE